MRLRLVLLSAFFLAACSSGPTKPSESTPGSKTVPAPAAATETKAEPKDAKKKSSTSAASGEKVECKVSGDERSLEVRSSGKGCELAYVKGGNEGIVATSANGTEHCVSVQTKIKERLEGAGFKCN